MAHTVKHLIADRRAASLVEFAIVLPLLICLLFGILGYGQYFMLAHSVQQIANDAARATVAGLTPAERITLAKSSVADDVTALNQFRPSRISTAITETGETVAVNVTLDGNGMALFRTALVPMPDPKIERRAVVRRGGLS